MLEFEGLGMTSRRTRERMLTRLREQGIDNEDVLRAIGMVPRHLFLDEALSHRAYEDTALPIGYGQTLSQPYIVARMTQLLLEKARRLDRVMEIGTGSGYQTAVLIPFVKTLWSVERILPLQRNAKHLLSRLGISHVNFVHADGGLGWSEKAPYDAIICAAAPNIVPNSLLQQLGEDGVLVLPAGVDNQYLKRICRKGASDEFITETLEPVNFVPLTSGLRS